MSKLKEFKWGELFYQRRTPQVKSIFSREPRDGLVVLSDSRAGADWVEERFWKGGLAMGGGVNAMSDDEKRCLAVVVAVMVGSRRSQCMNCCVETHNPNFVGNQNIRTNLNP
jgi:hypothetical protein